MARRPVVILAALLCLQAAHATALEIPPYRSAVNDLGEILSSSEERRLESRIQRYRDSTGIEIGVLTVASLEGAAVEDFAHDVFKAWGIGEKTRDNGVLFLVAWEDHAARLEVGYGLEGALTDVESGRIVSRNSPMADEFRAGRVGEGCEAVLDGVEAAVAGDYDPPAARGKDKKSQSMLLAFVAVMMLVMFISAVQRRRARKLGLWGRGSWGGTGLGGLGGWGSMGGFGGRSGGSSSGGGFHFGGGSSGGGGASGGW